jgi:nitroimidazol reductase NimA-like FMN-containing flavoprotein (pyridoxamine 5'-phosphate oxidase superfamily)
MLGELNENQIEALLKSQVIGRIGCHTKGTTYIVPVNYVYDGTHILAHSTDGLKMGMLRENPEICFEIDHVTDMVNWECVIVWGVFEELTGLEEKQQGMQKLIDQISPFLTGADTHPSHGITARESDIGNDIELIFYKINISKKTGRFEKTAN